MSNGYDDYQKEQERKESACMTRKAPFWVTMTDKAMSGWGRAEGKTNKLAFPRDSYEEAEIVYDNAINYPMNYVNIRSSKPNFNERGVMYQCKDKLIYPIWYKKGAIKK